MLGFDYEQENTIVFNGIEYKNSLGGNSSKENLEYLYDFMRTYSKDKLVFYNACDVMTVPSIFLSSEENWNSIEIHNAGYHGYAAYHYDIDSTADNSYVSIADLTALQNYPYIKGKLSFKNHDTETIYFDSTEEGSSDYEINNMLKNVAPNSPDWVKTQDIAVSNLGVEGALSEIVIDNIKELIGIFPMQIVYNSPFEKSIALYNDLGMIFKLDNYYCVYTERTDALSIVPAKYLSDIRVISAADLSSTTAEEIIACLNEFNIDTISHIYDYTGVMSDDTVTDHNKFLQSYPITDVRCYGQNNVFTFGVSRKAESLNSQFYVIEAPQIVGIGDLTAEPYRYQASCLVLVGMHKNLNLTLNEFLMYTVLNDENDDSLNASNIKNSSSVTINNVNIPSYLIGLNSSFVKCKINAPTVKCRTKYSTFEKLNNKQMFDLTWNGDADFNQDNLEMSVEFMDSNKIYTSECVDTKSLADANVNTTVTIDSNLKYYYMLSKDLLTKINADINGTGDIVPGDANADGEVDIRDVTMYARYIVKLADLNDEQFNNADIIRDGTVNIKDLRQLKKYLIKTINYENLVQYPGLA